MGESKHTPRWFSRGIDLIEVSPEAPPFTTLEAVAPSHTNCLAIFDTAEQATLAAAAPLMLEALRDLAHPERRTDCNERNCGECSTCRARAAIKAATGGHDE